MKRYAIIGWPLKHSLSPEIHNPAFKKLRIDAVYEKIEIDPDNFEKDINKIKGQDYSGFNVTIPYKSRIITFLDKIDEQAKAVGAVNTICIEDGIWSGYNTDIDGFIAPLLKLKRQFNDCLILGNGGAARAVVYAILKYFTPKELILAGRSLEKVEKLKSNFLHMIRNTEFTGCLIKNLNFSKVKPDLIINSTPIGTTPNIQESPLPQIQALQDSTVVYDLVYNPQQTQLLQDAEKAGNNIITINGIEMLVGQAAKAFSLWTGKDLPVEFATSNLLRILSK